jgi:hypothetical protein
VSSFLENYVVKPKAVSLPAGIHGSVSAGASQLEALFGERAERHHLMFGLVVSSI